MKRVIASLLWLSVSATVLTSCSKSQESGEATTNSSIEEKMAVFSVIGDSVYEFGNVVEGDTVQHTFKFVNKGEFPLIINNVQTSCGCTAPEWPKQPIAPGEESAIQVRFDTRGKLGQQVKTIAVLTNTKEGSNQLTIKGTVNPMATATK
jgi:hypothetical protein